MALEKKKRPPLLSLPLSHSLMTHLHPPTTHIDITKTYGEEEEEGVGLDGEAGSKRDLEKKYLAGDAVLLSDLSLSRASDVLTLLSILQGLVLSLTAPPTWVIGQALFWRIIHTYGLGYILWRQGRDRWWVRRTIREGRGAREEAFASWKSLYNASSCMVHSTFAGAVIRYYLINGGGGEEFWLLRHIIAGLLVLLHLWTTISVHDILGDYGWFYGDFFLEEYPHTLRYTGIYRFLNNPEKVLGHAGLWGGVILVGGEWSLVVLTIFSHISSLLFLSIVEAPHMRKIYGEESIRKDAGLVKQVRGPLRFLERRVLGSRDLERWKGGSIEEGWLEQWVERWVDQENPISRLMKQLRTSWIEGPRLARALEIARVERRDWVPPKTTYHLDLQILRKDSRCPSPIPGSPTIGSTGHLGQSVCVRWKVSGRAKGHQGKDWIGLYLRGEMVSDQVTMLSSQGCWSWVPEGEEGQEGEVIFKGDQLPWRVGELEARYHFCGGHTVLARSLPIPWALETSLNGEEASTIAASLLPLTRRILDDEDWSTSQDWGIGRLSNSNASRLVYGIQKMYQVDLSIGTIKKDRNLQEVSERVSDDLICGEIFF